ncbi:MAG: hypothetical protein ACR2PL_07175, partial [Dehalococcoidia bacterium]
PAPGAQAPAPASATPAVSGTPIIGAPRPSPTATARAVGTPAAMGTPAATGTPAAVPQAPPPQPTAYIDPSTGLYYVELTLCVTSSGGQTVANDPLTIGILDAAGTILGQVTATTGSNGCFTGDVQVSGPGGNVQPASLTISDPSGGATTQTVLLCAPLYRPPANPIISS